MFEIKAQGGKSASDILKEQIPERAKELHEKAIKNLPFAADGFKSTKSPEGVKVEPTGFTPGKIKEEVPVPEPKKTTAKKVKK